MLWRALLALALLCSVVEAQPVTISWRPPTGCTSGQAIVWNGSAWTCGSVVSTAGAGITLTGSTFDVIATTGGGLTVAADSVGLLTSCSTNEILKWSGSAWACAADDTIGSGAVAGTGTANTMAKWSGAATIANSLLTDNATTLSYNAGAFTVTAASGNTTVGGTLASTGAITDGGNRVFSIAGAGMTSSGATVNVIGGTGITVNADDVTYDSAVIQSRVGFTCTLPNSIRAIAADGSVTCTTASLDTSNVSGTSGRSARFSGSNTVGNGALTDDGTNATIAGTFGLTRSSSDTQLSIVNTSTGGRSYIIGAGGNGSANPNALYIEDSTAAALRLSISSAGVVSVPSGGTTAANWTTTGTGDLVSADDLTVSDDATITDVLTVNGNTALGNADTDSVAVRGDVTLTETAADTSPVIVFVNDARTWWAGIDGSSSDSFQITEGGVGTWLSIAKTTGATTIGGAVGIGTAANSTVKLDVRDATANDVALFYHSGGAGTYTASSNFVEIRNNDTSTNYDLLDVNVNNDSAKRLSFSSAGLLTSGGGGTTTANWITTGSGDLISGDDLTVADDATITDALQVDGNATLGDATTDTTTALGPLTALRITPATQIFDHTRGTEYFDDFFTTPGADTEWLVLTPTAILNAAWDSNHPGVAWMNVQPSGGALISGGASIANVGIVQGDRTQLTQGSTWFAGGGETKGAWLVRFETDPTNTNFSAVIGMFDEFGDITPQDGIYFLADNATSANWQVCTAEAGTRTCADTVSAIPLTPDEWFRLEWTVNAAGTSVSFTVTNVTTPASGTNTSITNIPNDSTHVVGLGAQIIRFSTTGSGTMYVDYAWLDQTFTTAR